jgi:hypothetical protein
MISFLFLLLALGTQAAVPEDDIELSEKRKKFAEKRLSAGYSDPDDLQSLYDGPTAPVQQVPNKKVPESVAKPELETKKEPPSNPYKKPPKPKNKKR